MEKFQLKDGSMLRAFYCRIRNSVPDPSRKAAPKEAGGSIYNMTWNIVAGTSVRENNRRSSSQMVRQSVEHPSLIFFKVLWLHHAL